MVLSAANFQVMVGAVMRAVIYPRVVLWDDVNVLRHGVVRYVVSHDLNDPRRRFRIRRIVGGGRVVVQLAVIEFSASRCKAGPKGWQANAVSRGIFVP